MHYSLPDYHAFVTDRMAKRGLSKGLFETFLACFINAIPFGVAA